MKTLTVDKVFTDTEMDKIANTFIKPSQINRIFNEDVDIFTTDGTLLIRFRKKVLNPKDIKAFYDATYEFTTKNPTSNRGSSTGSKSKNVYDNPKVMSAILGYYDRWGPNHKATFNKLKMSAPLEVRETRFSADHPAEFKQTFPLIQDINKYYKKLMPEHFKKQNKKAKETPFKIPGTSFTTITTNINFQTSIHKDKGDDGDGFGNLVVIEKGKYDGGETCIPQYGIGINVREGDVLFMNVHEWHGNLPIIPKEKDTVRMSVVCYLRTKVWKRTRHKSLQFKERHLKTIKRIQQKVRTTTTTNPSSKTKKKKNKNSKHKREGKHKKGLFSIF
jgi:hypothetical protein